MSHVAGWLENQPTVDTYILLMLYLRLHNYNRSGTYKRGGFRAMFGTQVTAIETHTRRDFLATSYTYEPEVIEQAVSVWATSKTDADTPRHRDLVRDKKGMVLDFFYLTEKHPADITAPDVQAWLSSLEERGLASSTIYGHASRLSSWYKWAASDSSLAELIHHNPVTLARPKAPKPYNNAQALSPYDCEAILETVPRDTLTGKRDYAMLLFFLLTAHRRAEVVGLSWGDLQYDAHKGLTVSFKVKGGDYEREEVDRLCWEATIEYLEASGRMNGMYPDTPLWVGHSKGQKGNKQLTSHAFVNNFKRYCKAAGLGDVHLHQLRHTVANMYADEAGDIAKVQTLLGHKNQQTTRVYVNKIAVKKNTHSSAIAQRLNL